MNPEQIKQARSALGLIGTVLIVVALAKLSGIQIPLRAAWWEIGLAGYLTKEI